jgi:hypothetical protein
MCLKTILSILAVLIFAIKLPAADTNAPAPSKAGGFAPLKIGTLEAANYYDQMMIVTGKVAQVTIRPTVTFLNLDKPFPDSPFTVVIFHGHSGFFGDANALKGKSIEIKGKIKNYHDKPEIALDSTNQLTVFDSKGAIITSTILRPAAAPSIPSPANAPPVAPSTNGIPEIM